MPSIRQLQIPMLMSSHFRIVMSAVLKLEVLAMTAISEYGFITNSELIPSTLHSKLQMINLVNGEYRSTDSNDVVSHIEVVYNGEMLKLNFNIFNNVIEIAVVENEKVPMNQKLLYSIEMDDKSEMGTEVSIEKNCSIVTLESEDSKWHWRLVLQIQMDETNQKKLTLRRRLSRKIQFKNRKWIGNCKEKVSIFESC